MGKAKAQLHANVTGIMNVYGFVSRATANAAATGIIILDVAVLDVSSVNQMIRFKTMNTMPAVDNAPRPLSDSPKNADKPLSMNPLARAKPPPKRKTISYGSSLAVFQSSSSVFVPLSF